MTVGTLHYFHQTWCKQAFKLVGCIDLWLASAFIHRCNRPSAGACSHGGQWWQEWSLLTGQHAEGPPEPQRGHRRPQGALESAPYSPVPWNWHCAAAGPPRTPHGPSPPERNNTHTHEPRFEALAQVRARASRNTEENQSWFTPLCRAVRPHLSLASTLAPLLIRE